MEPDDSTYARMARFHGYRIPDEVSLVILACVYILKGLLSPFSRVEVLGASQLARVVLAAGAWPQEVVETE
jgi:hypothetical protein